MNRSIVPGETLISRSTLRTGVNRPVSRKLRKVLLLCGIFASVLYMAMNLFIPMFYEGYDWVSQTVSELSAVDSPTMPLWFVLGTLYTLLVASFGFGIRQSAGDNRSLRFLGVLVMISGIVGLAWSPMHQREVIAAGGRTFTDTWHLIMSVISLLLMMLIIGSGAASLGKPFRLYSIASVVVFIVFGILTSLEAPGIESNDPTPLIGVWERINIGVYLLWMIVLSIVLMRRKAIPGH